MLKRLLGKLGRASPLPVAAEAIDSRAAWTRYASGDLYPPHDFSPLYRDQAAHLALMAFHAGRFGDALANLETSTIPGPAAQACVALLRAHALREQFQYEDEIAELDAVIALEPRGLRARALRCEALYCLGRFSEAERDHHLPLPGAGPGVRGWALLGAMLAEARREFSLALHGYRESLAAFPHIIFARSNLGYALIRAGKHREGFEELRRASYESGALPMERASPVWSGEPLDTRPLLLVAEFGLGDMVQFLRYAAVVRERFPNTPLWLKAPHTLERAAQGTGWFDRVVAPDFNFTGGFHSPLMQLPLLLGAESNLWPTPFPYLRPNPADVGRFAGRMDRAHKRALIGLCWAGKLIEIDARRSVPLASLLPLLERFHTKAGFVSLQLGSPLEEAAALPETLRPLDLASDLDDVAATVALCSHLDLVISVDTSVAHIAGAAGVPVWLLSRPDVDFRWETPGVRDGEAVVGYYPLTRVFRHPGGDLNWKGMVQELGAALEAWLAARTRGG